ncbi:MAG: peptidase S24 [Proteobacteria bacterium]|nr:peptidase S24 [Pseudomonadota bacterium]
MDLIAHRDPPSDLKRASLACGKNHAYLHQFVHRGTPRRLPEDVRYALAAHLGVDQSVLRNTDLHTPPLDPHPNPPPASRNLQGASDESERLSTVEALDERIVPVPELRVSNLTVGGDPAEPGENADHWCFPLGWVRHGLKARPEALRIIGVDGDTMEPLFRSGDHLLIDTDRRAPSPPGIFVLFDGVGLIPRMLEFLPNSDPQTVLVRSPGGAVRDLEAPLVDIQIIGRAVWHARRL